MKVLIPILIFLLMFSNVVSAQEEAETFAVVDSPVVFTQSLEERKKEIDCLANNIYFEARGEPIKGQMAIGVVTINRVKDSRYPDDLCEVVKQPAQFSWYKPGKAIKHSGTVVYDRIRELAIHIYDKYYTLGKEDDVVHGATHFHTVSINPRWRNKTKISRIGHHVFFKVGK
jgi:spore germination cell wall hydrolase CwlJ-like protein